MEQFLTKFDDILYTWCLIYLLAGAGIFFTVRTKFAQIRLLKDSVKWMFEKKAGGEITFHESDIGLSNTDVWK